MGFEKFPDAIKDLFQNLGSHEAVRYVALRDVFKLLHPGDDLSYVKFSDVKTAKLDLDKVRKLLGFGREETLNSFIDFAFNIALYVPFQL